MTADAAIPIRKTLFPNARPLRLRDVLMLTAFFYALAQPPSALALELTLQWLESTDRRTIGYRIYYGNSSGRYDTRMDVGKVTRTTLSQLKDGVPYYFAVVAHDGREESVFSNEAQYIPALHNRAPTAVDGSLEAVAGTANSGRLQASDRDGNSLRFSIVSPPTKGSITLNNPLSGAFTYTPGAGASGTDSFTFKAHDGLTDSNVARVNIGIRTSSVPSGTGSSSPTSPGTGSSLAGGDSVVLAINAGGGTHVDSSGVTYQSDTYFKGGSTYATTQTIDCSLDGPLYQTERFGSFSYHLPLPAGDYMLTLRLAEIFCTRPGERVFDIWVEGRMAAEALDLVRSAGPLTRYDLLVPVRVTDGSLDIQFTAMANQPKLSAILVRRSPQKALWAVNAGGERTVASTGIEYGKEQPCLAGRTASTANPIAGSPDPALYRTERYGNFQYDLPVANGTYLLTLHFAETYWDRPGQRIFDVVAEDAEIVSDLDILAACGKGQACDFSFPVHVRDGVLNLRFRTDRDNAQVCAVLLQTL